MVEAMKRGNRREQRAGRKVGVGGVNGEEDDVTFAYRRSGAQTSHSRS